MKYVKLFFFNIFAIILLTGCQSNDINLAICGSYAVPGMFCYDLKGDAFKCEVLEKDSQGRILYSYTTQSIITGKQEKAIIICQIIDDEYVYFYEDNCYLLGEPTDSEILKLKERNDWEKDIAYDKMAMRSNKMSLDSVLLTKSELEYKEIELACCQKLQIQETEIKELCFLDKNNSNQELYWLVVEKEGLLDKYCVLIDTHYEIAHIKMNGVLEDISKIKAFKKDSGWRQGDGFPVP